MKIHKSAQSVFGVVVQPADSVNAESYHRVYRLQATEWHTNNPFPPDTYKSQVLRMQHRRENISCSSCSRIS